MSPPDPPAVVRVGPNANALESAVNGLQSAINDFWAALADAEEAEEMGDPP